MLMKIVNSEIFASELCLVGTRIVRRNNCHSHEIFHEQIDA